VPKSKVRKKPEGSLPRSSGVATSAAARAAAPSPSWYPIVMALIMLIGLAYLVVYYLAGDKIGFMNSLSGWNFAVGFGIMVLGLLMAVRWR